MQPSYCVFLSVYFVLSVHCILMGSQESTHSLLFVIYYSGLCWIFMHAGIHFRFMIVFPELTRSLSTSSLNLGRLRYFLIHVWYLDLYRSEFSFQCAASLFCALRFKLQTNVSLVLVLKCTKYTDTFINPHTPTQTKYSCVNTVLCRHVLFNVKKCTGKK